MGDLAIKLPLVPKANYRVHHVWVETPPTQLNLLNGSLNVDGFELKTTYFNTMLNNHLSHKHVLNQLATILTDVVGCLCFGLS